MPARWALEQGGKMNAMAAAGKRFPLSGLLAAVLVMLLCPLQPSRAESTVQLTARFTSERSGLAETSLGDVAADAIRSAAGAEVALVDAEALRTVSFPRGSVKASQIQAVFNVPGEPIVVLTVRGEVLAAALSRGLSNLPQSSPGFLQVSGIAFTLNEGAAPGARAGTIVVEGKPLDRGANYTVAMPQSLAQGANGYFLVWPVGGPSRAVAQGLGSALAAYLAEHPTLSPAAPRIIR